MRDTLLTAIVIVCSIVALRRPFYGVLTVAGLTYLNPQSFTWTFGRTFRYSQIMGAATIAGYVLSRERKPLLNFRETRLLIMLWATFGISTLFAIQPAQALARLILVSKTLLMAFLSTSLITTQRRLHLLLRVIAFSLGFYALKGGVFVLLTGGKYTVWGPELSVFEASNSIGFALAMNIPLLVLLSRIETHPWLRLLTRVMLLLSYPATIATYSRGAWLGLAVATALLVLRSKYRIRLVTAGLALGILFGPSLLKWLPDRLVDRYDELVQYEQEASAESRFWNWEFCKRVGLAQPLYGAGFEFYGRELYAKYFPEFIDRWGTNKYWSCHSMWFTILGEHGVPAVILWVTLLGSCLLSLRQLRLFGRTHPGMLWIAHYAEMLHASLVTFMVIGTFLDTAYFSIYYDLVAVIIILKGIVGRGQTEASLSTMAGDVEIASTGSKQA